MFESNGNILLLRNNELMERSEHLNVPELAKKKVEGYQGGICKIQSVLGGYLFIFL